MCYLLGESWPSEAVRHLSPKMIHKYSRILKVKNEEKKDGKNKNQAWCHLDITFFILTWF